MTMAGKEWSIKKNEKKNKSRGLETGRSDKKAS